MLRVDTRKKFMLTQVELYHAILRDFERSMQGRDQIQIGPKFDSDKIKWKEDLYLRAILIVIKNKTGIDFDLIKTEKTSQPKASKKDVPGST